MFKIRVKGLGHLVGLTVDRNPIWNTDYTNQGIIFGSLHAAQCALSFIKEHCADQPNRISQEVEIVEVR